MLFSSPVQQSDSVVHTHTYICIYVCTLFMFLSIMPCHRYWNVAPVLYSVTLLFVTLFYIPSFLSQYYACAFWTCSLPFFSSKAQALQRAPHLTLKPKLQSFSLICSWTALILWSKDQLNGAQFTGKLQGGYISALPHRRSKWRWGSWWKHWAIRRRKQVLGN